MEKWTIAKIKQANEVAGGVFFDKSHLKHSKTLPKVYEGPGGVAFLTLDKDLDYSDKPLFKVWNFNAETGQIFFVDSGNTLIDAGKAAREWVAAT